MTTIHFHRTKEGWFYKTDSGKLMGPFATRSIALKDAADYFLYESDIKPPVSEAA